MIDVVSPPRSFEGYSLRAYLVRNKESLKELVSIVLGLATVFIPQIKSTELSLAAGAAVKVVSKMAMDAIDFWFSSVTIPPPGMTE